VVPEVENDEVRELIYGAYRVLYQVQESVEILTVRHGSQVLHEDEVGGERT
jgi:toxin ParE1/3/4